MALVKFLKNKLVEVINKMKFDIYNRTTRQMETGVFADTPQMLHQVYAMAGEEIEIQKVVNEKPVNDLGIISAKPLNDLTESTMPPIESLMHEDEPIHFSSPVLLNNKIIPTLPEKFFSDNGIEYKINSEGSYKKSWVDVDLKNFRVINIETGKEDKLKNKKIQTLDWIKIG